MAMAFAPLALKLNTITIEEPSVVTKSYPMFWKDIKN
jgi:3-phosphoshikimate 1-carboxyvinyltransferase